jgi:hypothetical protein
VRPAEARGIWLLPSCAIRVLDERCRRLRYDHADHHGQRRPVAVAGVNDGDRHGGRGLRIRARRIKCSRFGVTPTLMKCWHCDLEAKAVCAFCGRGVCVTHRKAKEYFVVYGKKHADALIAFSSATAANVLDASWCGVCEVLYADTY